ncbi:MAG TPA: methyltransferase domain-containing protein [Acidobacteriota bacterium]|nr:methyltransferase domain-containing protein [Acidobacteriota bacterium]
MQTTFDRDRIRSNLLPYTRKAFGLLPKLSRPRILDIGCGSGAATLELARISGGDIVALDIDKDALDRLVTKAKEEDLLSRITVVHASMLEMDFPPNTFDVIWTEGAISYIGFERGLSEWHRLLMPEGYLVVHDAVSDLQRKIELTHTCGYTILGQFELPPDIWWNEYYAPLKRELETLKGAGSLDQRVANEMKTAEREIAEFDSESDRFSSVFFVLKRA